MFFLGLSPSQFCWDNKWQTKTAVPLQNNGTRQGLQSFANEYHWARTTVLCKWIPLDKGHSPLQMNSRRQGRNPLQMNTKLLVQQSRMLVSEPQFLIFRSEMLTIETAVSSANLWNSRFHEPWEESSSPCFTRTTVHLNLLGQKRKIRTAVSLQTNGTRQGRSPLQMNSTRQVQQSFANEYH